MNLPYLQVGRFYVKYHIFQFSWETDGLAALGPHLCRAPGAGPSLGHMLSSFSPTSPHSTLRGPLFKPIPPRLLTWLTQLLGVFVCIWKVCICNVWSPWSPWWQEVGRSWLTLRSLPLLPEGWMLATSQHAKSPHQEAEIIRWDRNFWNGGKGHVLNLIFSNVRIIYCLIGQVDKYWARRAAEIGIRKWAHESGCLCSNSTYVFW